MVGRGGGRHGFATPATLPGVARRRFVGRYDGQRLTAASRLYVAPAQERAEDEEQASGAT